MNRTLVLKYFFALICVYSLNCQTSLLAQKTQNYYVADSLKNYSFEELFNKQYSNENNNEIYIRAYLNKAKNKKDTLKIAHGYSQKASIELYKDSIQNALKYLDSIISFTKNKKYKDYPGYGYLWKGFILLNSGKYDDALENLLLAQKFANKRKNIKQLLSIKQNIGTLKFIWGNKDEATNNFLYVIENLNYPEVSESYRTLLKSKSYMFLTYGQIQKENFDSAYVYSDLCIKYLSKKDSIHGKKFSLELNAEIEYYKKNYSESLALLNKLAKLDSCFTNEFNYNYLYGSALNNLNRKEEAFTFYSKADSIYKASKDLMPDTRKVKEFFIKYYKEKNDTKNQLLFIDQLLVVDSLIDVNTKTLNTKIKKEYDEPQLLAEKEKIINELSSKFSRNKLLLVILISLGIISLFAFYFYFKKQKHKFENLIKDTEETKITGKTINSSKIDDIPTEVIEQIKLKLADFEHNSLFTENNLTLAKLAKELETNSSYLSKTINHYKQKNFSSYITELRIDYCIKKMKNNDTFRKFSIKAIANEVGFNNTESFSKAFYSKTGLYPSNFIKTLK